MTNEHQQSLTRYVAAFIEEMVGNGVEEVVISPGSRSTPLALLCAHHPHIKTYINVDERSAAFFALGIAKAKNKPVALLCSSGTAGANYYPAVIEARYSKIPLVVMTADRPHELREVGAPQAINQIDLFGKHVKWSIDMALPENSPSMIQYAKSSAVKGIGLSMGEPRGPVHYNFPFREPLIPNLNEIQFGDGNKGKRVLHGSRGLHPTISEELKEALNNKERGLLVCGPGLDEQAIGAVIEFSKQYQLPIVADPLSLMRSGNYSKDQIMDSYDTFLKVKELKEDLRPDIVIRFGAMPVSKSLMLFLKSLTDIPFWIISRGEDWQDPIAAGKEYIYCDEQLFCTSMQKEDSQEKSEWLSHWKNVNNTTKELLLNGSQEWDEGLAVRQLLEELPNDSTLFASNSMPIRDIDTYFFHNERNIQIYANRGANGIDGVVSTALGMSTQKKPLYLLIGDLAFFHDLNALLIGRKYQLDVTIVVLNNNGGGIFSYLPQAKEENHFEELFGTPMDLEFFHAAQLYGAHHTLVKEQKDFIPALEHAKQTKGIKVIEVLTNREDNVGNHRNLWNFVSREMVEKFKGNNQ
ncbi:2-succinyl-5-enolpyruvyl-6-hydroxy-3-cyclohexene-1-carboxylic-acid synthase [Rossellomorea aquimaris]|uniref:2-succinyl-5-enolpyruvyl-6-hydroxy-3- cyclohexene-1-carboxylic-acid synthase n=1 Tax=Rossellomorea aquimaris TaxID=189382 RepID=UPI0007D07CC8|nr:2-succinyl-5-enolpyruvyl-6-hydroxy-3-cyclohexene-1-carboxylic-acid synthase [Rossellomorea aquimaris]